jgi:hypothetical protein
MASVGVMSTFPGVMGDEYTINGSDISHGDCFQPHSTLIELDELVSGVTKGDKKIKKSTRNRSRCLAVWSWGHVL